MLFKHCHQSHFTALHQLEKCFPGRDTAWTSFIWRPSVFIYMKRNIILLGLGALVALLGGTNIFSNLFMLLTERVNQIPDESNIFAFSPYEINQGSSSYWLYGEDSKSYYHFSYSSTEKYWLISKENNCPDFSKYDSSTWCSAQAGKGD